ncbi:MAG: sigma-70 family RNA polymerase sigma factor [Ferruginibacter sp.]
MPETQQLIQGCIKGNRYDQNRLYQLYASAMFSVCLRYSKNKEEAEEILQEGFMKVFTHLHQFNFEGSFEGWIRKIMVNCALQKYRSNARLHAVVDIETNQHEIAETENIMAQIGTKELLNMVQQLPPGYRLVFNMYVFEGMKHREIAEQLGISEGTSKSNLYDARVILQKSVTSSLQVAKKNINCL